MSPPDPAAATRRFVTAAEAVTETTPFTLNAWLARPDVVPCRDLLLVRATMAPGDCHPFHHHPNREEIIYVLSGQAEQWCGGTSRVLHPGEMVLIPRGEVHGTYNPFREPLVFLAILAPADAPGPDTVDVSSDPDWAGRRTPRSAATGVGPWRDRSGSQARPSSAPGAPRAVEG